MPRLAPSLASVATPHLSGGGAEKVTRMLALHLADDGRLSRLYLGDRRPSDDLASLTPIVLGHSRALPAALAFARRVFDDPAEVFVLSLGFINLAPVLRLRRPRARIVLRIGNTLSADAALRSGLARRRYMAAIRLAARFADRIVVQCDFMRHDFVRAIPGAAEKVVVIHNFVEEELLAHADSPERPLDNPYIFCAASFKPQKNLPLLLEAFARSPARAARRLVIAGVRPDDAEFAKLVTDAGLLPDEVLRLGQVAAPYDWMAHADLAVLASDYEGFSNFLLEAAALGKRIVATDCPGGNRELFAPYGNADTVPVGDMEALADKLALPRRDLDRGEARRRLAPFEREAMLARYHAVLFGPVPR